MRAATQGRVLVLEGLEKAERNVLPVLNNLLENREMQLEDGRFLMSAERYDKLLQVRAGDSPTQTKHHYQGKLSGLEIMYSPLYETLKGDGLSPLWAYLDVLQ